MTIIIGVFDLYLLFCSIAFLVFAFIVENSDQVSTQLHPRTTSNTGRFLDTCDTIY